VLQYRFTQHLRAYAEQFWKGTVTGTWFWKKKINSNIHIFTQISAAMCHHAEVSKGFRTGRC